MSKFYQINMAFVFAALFAGFFGCNKAKNYQGSSSNKEIIFASGSGEVKFTAEIFDTEQERELGLMNRKSLPPNHGGLFVFPEMKNQIFWMKNTYISLDLIFFDDDFTIVGVIENTTPLSLEYLSINKKSRYVLEVLAGTVKQYGINSNMRVRVIRE